MLVRYIFLGFVLVCIGCSAPTHTVVSVSADSNSLFSDIDMLSVEVCGKAANALDFGVGTCIENRTFSPAEFGFPFTVDVRALGEDASREFRVVFRPIKDGNDVGSFSVRSGFREGERLVTRLHFADECHVSSCTDCLCGVSESCGVNVGVASCTDNFVEPASLEVLSDEEAERLRELD